MEAMPDLTIGVLFPLSGPSGEVGQQCEEAARAAVEMIPVRGWRIRVAIGNAHSPAAAATEADRLVREEGATVVIGTLFSDLNLAASEVVSRLGGMYWEATASADEVTKRRLHGVFRVGADARRYAETAVDYVADVLVPLWGMKSGQIAVATLVESAVFPRSFGEATAARSAERGFSVTSRLEAGTSHQEIAALVRNTREASPHVVFSAGFDDFVPAVWRELRRQPLGLRAMVGISAWGLSRDPRWKATGYDRVFASTGPYLWNMNRAGLAPEMRGLLEGFWARSSTPPADDVAVDRDMVFAATHVLLNHIVSAVNDARPAGLIAAARALDLPFGTTPIGAGVRFDELGNNTRAMVTMLQWQEGRRVMVAPAAYATGTPITDPPAI